MHTTPQNGSEGAWLRARRERIGESVDLRVDCPRRGREVSVATCEGCGAARTLASDESGLSVYVHCAEAGGAAPEARRMPAPATLSRVEADPTVVPVTRIMQKTVAVTDASLPAARLAESLLEEGIGAAPVVDADGRLLGMVTKTDLVGLPADGAATAGDLMSRGTYAARPEMSIAEVAALMGYEGVHHLPVVDDDGRVIGVVSTMDVTRWVAQAAGFHAPSFGPSA